MDVVIFKRNNCVMCENNRKLNYITDMNIPCYLVSFENIPNQSWNIKYGYCEECYSVQLMTLLDPKILYDKNYIQPNNDDYNWVQHNISLAKFIISSIEINKPLIEIGSSSFVLGKHLIEYYKDYTIFDYSLEQSIKRENIKYIEGNCENYKFEKGSNIIMSHVFEHLYEPKKFIKNCQKSGVKNIVIAIPSMNNTKELSITNQHTFMYNDNDIEYMFGLYNYNSINKYFFLSNDQSFPCIFFHFQLTNSEINIQRNIVENRHEYHEKIFKSINVSKKTFLSTAGSFTAVILSLIENKENIVGIIDNNNKLHGKKYGNSEITIYPYEYLKNYDNDTDILVYIYRRKDVISCIKKINQKINIIEF